MEPSQGPLVILEPRVEYCVVLPHSYIGYTLIVYIMGVKIFTGKSPFFLLP